MIPDRNPGNFQEAQRAPEVISPLKEWEIMKRVGEKALNEVQTGLENHLGIKMPEDSKKLLDQELKLFENRFYSNLELSRKLAADTLKAGDRLNEERIRPTKNIKTRLPDGTWKVERWLDPTRARIERLRDLVHKGTPLWMVGGLLINRQMGGLKKIEGAANGKEYADIIHDNTVSAAADRYGHDNPFLMEVSSIYRHLGVSGHEMLHYHPSASLEFAVNEEVKFHPNTTQVNNGEIRFYSRHSGSEVNTTALEIVCDYVAEKFGTYKSAEIQKLMAEGNYKEIKRRELSGELIVPKVFAVDGTWAGGHSGAATEATGFGVDIHSSLHTGGEAWVKRTLKLFTKNNERKIMEELTEAIAKGECAGLIIEPNAAVDAGIVPVDPDVLRKVKDLLAQHGLPIIADCMQENGSMGSYLGDNLNKVLGDYDKLIITNAKSAALDSYGYMLIPAEIDKLSTKMNHLSTTTYDGPHGQAMWVEKFSEDPEIRAKLERDSAAFDRIADEYKIPLEENMDSFKPDTIRLRGKGMNRGWVVGDDYVNHAAFFFLRKYGILFANASDVLRDERNLLEFSSTHEDLTRIICKGLKEFEQWKNKNINSDKQDDLWKYVYELKALGDAGLNKLNGESTDNKPSSEYVGQEGRRKPIPFFNFRRKPRE